MSKQKPNFRVWFDRNGIEGYRDIYAHDALAAVEDFKPLFETDRVIMVQEII